MKFLHSKIQEIVTWLKNYVAKPWYPPLLATFAAADAILVVIPTDGLVVSSAMGTPRRWFVIGAWTALGSTLGALALAYFAGHYGLPWIGERFPDVVASDRWIQVSELFEKFGLSFLFGYSATPLPQLPAVLLAGLAEIGLLPLGLTMFAGRLIKFSVMAYAGARAPWLLKKLWGMKDELEEVGIVETQIRAPAKPTNNNSQS